MRLLKFRVFDGDKMVYFKNSGYTMETMFFTSHAHNDTGSCWHGYNLNHVHVMQFTGILDENGVEIYEGDLIKYANDEEEVPVMWIGSDACFGAKWKGVGYCPIVIGLHANVVGNIHGVENDKSI